LKISFSHPPTPINFRYLIAITFFNDNDYD